MKNIVVGALLLLLAVGIGISLFVMTNLNAIITEVIETQGTKVAETEVRVAGVDVSLKDGRGTLAGLTVANPSGFANDRAFGLGEITVDLDLGSVRKDPFVIEEIVVREPVVSAEFLESGALNLDRLRKSIQGYIPEKSDGSGENSEKKVRIRSFTFEEGRIEVDASALGLESRTLELPAIRLTEVGGDSGARSDEVAKVVMDALTTKALSAVARAEVEKQVEAEAEKQAQGLLEKVTR